MAVGVSSKRSGAYKQRVGSPLPVTWQPALPWERRWPIEESRHTGTARKHNQEDCRGLSEGSLWYSCRQDNTMSRMWQVQVSPFTTRRTEFFGWTGLFVCDFSGFCFSYHNLFLLSTIVNIRCAPMYPVKSQSGHRFFAAKLSPCAPSPYRKALDRQEGPTKISDHL